MGIERIHRHVIAAIASLAGLTAMACSSSQSAGPPANGSQTDAGSSSPPDAAPPAPDAATPRDAAPDAADAGTCSPSAAASSFTPPPYVPVAVHAGACSDAEISAFVAACGDNGSAARCDAWTSANVAGDAGVGTTCGNCVIAPQNNGAVWIDPSHTLGPNNAGCVELLDPTPGGRACAAVLDNPTSCDETACDACGFNETFNACVDAANAGPCASFIQQEGTTCASDLAQGSPVFQACFGSSSSTGDDVLTSIAKLICGTGIPDAGKD